MIVASQQRGKAAIFLRVHHRSWLRNADKAHHDNDFVDNILLATLSLNL
jgi:hypothetical protein